MNTIEVFTVSGITTKGGYVTGDRRVRGPTVYTRLVSDDYIRLTNCARAKGKTISATARTAIREYLNRFEEKQEEDRESIYAAQVRGSTNRICSLLAKVAIDVRAIYRFLGELEDMIEQLERCRAAAAHDIARSLSTSDRSVAERMSSNIADEDQKRGA